MGAWSSWGSNAYVTVGSEKKALLLNSLEIDCGVTRVAIPDPSADSGIGGYVTTKRTPRISFQVYRDLSEEVNLWSTQESETFTFQHGSVPGRIFAVCAPAARVAEMPTPSDSDGSVVSNVVLECDYYDGDGTANADNSGDTVPTDSIFRLAWL